MRPAFRLLCALFAILVSMVMLEAVSRKLDILSVLDMGYEKMRSSIGEETSTTCPLHVPSGAFSHSSSSDWNEDMDADAR